jgi:O-glycosyl hydrolase
VNDKVTYQRMEGAAAAFTDGAAWLINQKRSPVQRDEVMKRLFDPVEGIGVSFLRYPVGSSDLTREWYALDDNAADRNDPSLPIFSIDHDLTDVIPVTLTARKLNPNFTLMINAWSPPAWMKSSGSLMAGDVCTGLVVVNTDDARSGTLDHATEYYTLGQYTKFVPNGAVRIQSDDNPKVLNVAFQNPGGSLVLIA